MMENAINEMATIKIQRQVINRGEVTMDALHRFNTDGGGK
jgi:hypothetical protein